MPAKFPNDELVACAKREASMRRACYCAWDKVATVEELKPGRQKEIAMMETIVAQLEALPELIRRYNAVKGQLAATVVYDLHNEHPEHNWLRWSHAIDNDETRDSYTDWVAQQILLS